MEPQEKSVPGIHFCTTCNNILTPQRANEFSLEFKCRLCGKCDKDFTNAKDEEKLVYSKTDEASFTE